jgi:hypothetical protein
MTLVGPRRHKKKIILKTECLFDWIIKRNAHFFVVVFILGCLTYCLTVMEGKFFFFFQALNFLVESFGLLKDLFLLPSILDAGYPVLDLQLANVLCDVILPSVLGSSL